MGNEKSLAHTRWNCKYHIVFAPKYRRQVFYRERRAIGSILRKLCEWKMYGFWKLNAVQIISICLWRSAQNERIRLYGISERKNSLMLYEQFGDLKFKYRNREFWCRGYYVDTVGKNTAKIQDYIKHQLEEDKMGEQLSIPYPGSPFTGRK
ncbi:IS200/IS605 family transposase [Escherichia coli]|uniref:IS200/IS605 family transposase n=1 Tax=Escherichia coli TaxID=562 RepID=UPI002022F1F7|nr:IS200/IS605 family transposase [Escherichia coli]